MSIDIDPTEVLKTLHIRVDEVPFVEVFPGVEHRVLQFRPENDLMVSELRAQPGASTSLHRHLAPVLGWTTQGAWGHDRTYSYRPESYIFETPGVLHQFLNGPELTRALYVTLGESELVDPESGEVTYRATLPDQFTGYLEACEAAGLPRPNVLN
jgi:hypothetical protein